jgi:hypothetical protein
VKRVPTTRPDLEVTHPMTTPNLRNPAAGARHAIFRR